MLRYQGNGVAGDIHTLDLQGEGIALGVLIPEVCTQEQIQIGTHNKTCADADLDHINHADLLLVDFLFKQGDPIGFLLQHSRILFTQGLGYGITGVIFTEDVVTQGLLALFQHFLDLLAELFNILPFLLSLLVLLGHHGNIDADAGEVVHIGGCAHLIVSDVGNDSRPLPYGFAVHVDGDAVFLLKLARQGNLQFAVFTGLYIDLQTNLQHQPDTLKVLKVLQICHDSGFDLQVFHADLAFVGRHCCIIQRHGACHHRQCGKIHILHRDRSACHLCKVIGRNCCCCQIIGSLLSKAAFNGLLFNGFFQRSLLFLRNQIFTIHILGGVGVHGCQHFLNGNDLVSDHIYITQMGYRSNLAVFADLSVGQSSGVKGNKVAGFDLGILVQIHLGVSFIGIVHHSCRNSNGIIGCVPIRISAFRDRQHIGSKQHIGSACATVCIVVAIYSSDLNIRNTVIHRNGIQIQLAFVYTNHIADLKGLGGAGECTNGIFAFFGFSTVRTHCDHTDRQLRSRLSVYSKVSDVSNGQILHIIINRYILDFFLIDRKTVLTNGSVLSGKVQSVVIQRQLIRCTGLKAACAGNSKAGSTAGDSDKISVFHLVQIFSSDQALDSSCIHRLQRCNGNRKVFALIQCASNHICFGLLQLTNFLIFGIQSEVAKHHILAIDHVGQRFIVAPCNKYIVVLFRHGQTCHL